VKLGFQLASSLLPALTNILDCRSPMGFGAVSSPMWPFLLSNLAIDRRLGRLLPCQLPLNKVNQFL